jgi:hypothetical protein
MKTIHTLHEFFEAVGRLMFEDFLGLEIEPSTPLGIFSRRRLPELLEFCKKNPEYHVISSISALVLFNRPVESAGLYLLGAGDADPDLACIYPMDLESVSRSKILEFERDKARTMPDDVKNVSDSDF